jgi:Family of unknown function (DUF6788)
MRQTARPSPRRLRQQTTDLRRRISAMDYVSSGTLHSRTRPCGKTNCRCATDPDAWHGPYHDWTRRKDGRLVHSAVSPDQARIIQRAIANRREIDRLLARWEDETVAEILGPDRSTP